jgi:hypothetical protein
MCLLIDEVQHMQYLIKYKVKDDFFFFFDMSAQEIGGGFELVTSVSLSMILTD